MFNLYFLVQAVRQRRRRKRAANGAVDVDGKEEAGIEGGGLMVRILAPLMRVMDRPWKVSFGLPMQPVERAAELMAACPPDVSGWSALRIR
jgi:high-affinity nickel permease